MFVIYLFYCCLTPFIRFILIKAVDAFNHIRTRTVPGIKFDFSKPSTFAAKFICFFDQFTRRPDMRIANGFPAEQFGDLEGSLLHC